MIARSAALNAKEISREGKNHRARQLGIAGSFMPAACTVGDGPCALGDICHGQSADRAARCAAGRHLPQRWMPRRHLGEAMCLMPASPALLGGPRSGSMVIVSSRCYDEGFENLLVRSIEDSGGRC